MTHREYERYLTRLALERDQELQRRPEVTPEESARAGVWERNAVRIAEAHALNAALAKGATA
jgi:hypothetical protein